MLPPKSNRLGASLTTITMVMDTKSQLLMLKWFKNTDSVKNFGPSKELRSAA